MPVNKIKPATVNEEDKSFDGYQLKLTQIVDSSSWSTFGELYKNTKGDASFNTAHTDGPPKTKREELTAMSF